MVKKYGFLVAFILLVTLMVLLRPRLSTGYVMDATDILNQLNAEEIFVSMEALDPSGADALFVLNFTGTVASGLPEFQNTVFMDRDDIITRKVRNIVRDTGLVKVIVSDNLAEAIQSWMLIRQLGGRPLYILDKVNSLADSVWRDNEVLRYSFKPDSTVFKQGRNTP